jgi:hypothetical protein
VATIVSEIGYNADWICASSPEPIARAIVDGLPNAPVNRAEYASLIAVQDAERAVTG